MNYNQITEDFYPDQEKFSDAPTTSEGTHRGPLLADGSIQRRPDWGASIVGKKFQSGRCAKNAAASQFCGFALTDSIKKDILLQWRKTQQARRAKDGRRGMVITSLDDDMTQEEINAAFPDWKYLSEEVKCAFYAHRLHEDDRYIPFTLNLSPSLVERAYNTKNRTFASALLLILSKTLKNKFKTSVDLLLAVEIDNKRNPEIGRPHVHGIIALPSSDGLPSKKDEEKIRDAFHQANREYPTQGFDRYAVKFSEKRNKAYWGSNYMTKDVNKTRQFLDEKVTATSRSIQQDGERYFRTYVRTQPDRLRGAVSDETALTATSHAKTSENGLETLSTPTPAPKKADHFPDPLGRTKPPGMSDIEWIRMTRPSCRPKPSSDLTAAELDALLDSLDDIPDGDVDPG